MVVYNDGYCTKEGIIHMLIETIDGVEEVIDVSVDNPKLERLVLESVKVE